MAVIDKKRDMSLAGKYTTKDGRQGGRKKIARAPEEVIRVQVLEPLISESEFNQVQRIIKLKAERQRNRSRGSPTTVFSVVRSAWTDLHKVSESRLLRVQSSTYHPHVVQPDTCGSRFCGQVRTKNARA